MHPDVVDLHQRCRSFGGLRRGFAYPGLFPGERREWNARQRTGRKGDACAAAVAGTDNPAVGTGLVHSQVGLLPVGTALTLFRVAGAIVGQVVPGDVGQIAVFVHQHPRRLLQPTPARAALSRVCFGTCPCLDVPSIVARRRRPPPRRMVHQAAPQAPHPRREPQRRNPPDHRPVALHRPRRRTQRSIDAESAPDAVYVTDLPLAPVAAGAVPGTDVLHHHQTVRTAHDRAHRAVPQQVRKPNRNVFFSHRAEGSTLCRRSFRPRHVRPARRHFGGQSWTLNAPVPSTLRIELRVAHRPRRDSPWV